MTTVTGGAVCAFMRRDRVVHRIPRGGRRMERAWGPSRSCAHGLLFADQGADVFIARTGDAIGDLDQYLNPSSTRHRPPAVYHRRLILMPRASRANTGTTDTFMSGAG